MHVQVITFELNDVDEAEYRALCDELAPAFAALPGLISKVWLADATSGTYGGVYLWHDRAAFEAFTQTELFQAVASHPNLTGMTSKDFSILEGPTGVTRGLAAAAV